jgi:diphosphomevalonate decarboxylase
MPAIARAHPNIALVKYWGKRDSKRNLPAVDSLSITLGDLYTEMQLEFDGALAADELSINGSPDSARLARVSACIDSVAGADRPRARVVSHANFPVAAGLASSASAFAALVVAAAGAAGRSYSADELANLAGRASGSAARSLYDGFALLRNAGSRIRVESIAAPRDWPLRVVVAVTRQGPKPVSSTDAMESSKASSPFYARWVADQAADIAAARSAVADRDIAALAEVAERNCLKMHSVMWSSRPPVVYWNAATVECLQAVRALREEGEEVFFTIDAGPQVKAICTDAAEPRVRRTLAAIPGVSEILASGLGRGAELLEKS